MQLVDNILHSDSPQATVKARIAAGKALRKLVPRAVHGEYQPSPGRADPIAILEAQAETRLPDLVPVRHARMLASPFAYLRGSAAVMIADLAPAPTTGLKVQACGDMHVANFGVFASAERNLVFGINDFDETHPGGAWEWDLKRLVASAVVAGRFIEMDAEGCRQAARAVVSGYRKALHDYAHMGWLELWYASISEAQVLEFLPSKIARRAARGMARARGRNHAQVLEKLTDLIDAQHRIIEAAPLIVRRTHTVEGLPLAHGIGDWLQGYLASLSLDRQHLLSRYRYVDAARKVVGVGSVGTRCWVVYLQGRDSGDPLFLQIKEAQPSVLAPYLSEESQFDNQGHRVVAGQRLIQGAPDIFLGWGRKSSHDYYVRQLRDMKGGVDFATLRKSTLPHYCRLCGWALALAHAKSGDAAMLAGYVGKGEELDHALARFGEAYADQTDFDYQLLKAAAAQGRLAVAEGDVV